MCWSFRWANIWFWIMSSAACTSIIYYLTDSCVWSSLVKNCGCLVLLQIHRVEYGLRQEEMTYLPITRSGNKSWRKEFGSRILWGSSLGSFCFAVSDKELCSISWVSDWHMLSISCLEGLILLDISSAVVIVESKHYIYPGLYQEWWTGEQD